MTLTKENPKTKNEWFQKRNNKILSNFDSHNDECGPSRPYEYLLPSNYMVWKRRIPSISSLMGAVQSSSGLRPQASCAVVFNYKTPYVVTLIPAGDQCLNISKCVRYMIIKDDALCPCQTNHSRVRLRQSLRSLDRRSAFTTVKKPPFSSVMNILWHIH